MPDGIVTLRTRRLDDGGVELAVEDEGWAVSSWGASSTLRHQQGPGRGTGSAAMPRRRDARRRIIRAENLARGGRAAHRSAPRAITSRRPRRPLHRGSTERVLVVEDNGHCATSPRGCSTTSSYTVRAVASAGAALAEDLDDVDLVDGRRPARDDGHRAARDFAPARRRALVLVSGQATAGRRRGAGSSASPSPSTRSPLRSGARSTHGRRAANRLPSTRRSTNASDVCAFTWWSSAATTFVPGRSNRRGTTKGSTPSPREPISSAVVAGVSAPCGVQTGRPPRRSRTRPRRRRAAPTRRRGRRSSGRRR